MHGRQSTTQITKENKVHKIKNLYLLHIGNTPKQITLDFIHETVKYTVQ